LFLKGKAHRCPVQGSRQEVLQSQARFHVAKWGVFVII
jgi:hypothetical protein